MEEHTQEQVEGTPSSDFSTSVALNEKQIVSKPTSQVFENSESSNSVDSSNYSIEATSSENPKPTSQVFENSESSNLVDFPSSYLKTPTNTVSDVSNFLAVYFNTPAKIKNLYNRLNLPFEDVQGETVPKQIYELLSNYERENCLAELLEIVEEEVFSINGSVGVDETNAYLDNLYGPQIPGRVFISYSWDSKEHVSKVICFAQTLRDDGVDCIIDQFVQSPDNWDRWMLDQIDESDFVLIICSERYYKRYRGKEEVNKGLGVTWESTLILGKIYDSQGKNNKFYPVLFAPYNGINREIIPDGIRTSFYDLSTYDLINLDKNENRLSKDGAYQDLYRLLTKQPYVVPRKLGALKRLQAMNRGS